MPSDQIIVPFLKWAGGKRWFVSSHNELLPRSFNTYFEPFLGSGAMYFFLRPSQAVLSDTNDELITCYKALRDSWQKVFALLKRYHRWHSQEFYYQMRGTKPRLPHTKAARFIYLNRTCWNGLYRVNKRGKFNVPIGTKASVIFPSDDFASISECLNSAHLHTIDFEDAIDQAEAGDFLFVDPPYTVNHNHNGFIKYNEKIFTWKDQERLAATIARAKHRKVQILMTNANHSSIRSLYKNVLTPIAIPRQSILAASKESRRLVTELVLSG